MQFRFHWRFIRLINTREACDLACPGLCIEPLGISSLRLFKCAIHEDFKKWNPCRIVHPSHTIPVRTEGTHETGQDDDTDVRKDSSNLTNPANVLCSVGCREPKITIEPMAKIVAIQSIGDMSSAKKLLFHLNGNRALAAS